jgi:hypothetical protein
MTAPGGNKTAVAGLHDERRHTNLAIVIEAQLQASSKQRRASALAT